MADKIFVSFMMDEEVDGHSIPTNVVANTVLHRPGAICSQNDIIEIQEQIRELCAAQGVPGQMPVIVSWQRMELMED